MPARFGFDPARSALLSMDCQTGIVAIYVKEKDAFLARAAGVLKRARSLKMPVIHVRVGFRPGLPEVSSRNLLGSAIKASPQWQQLFAGPAGEIHSAIAPQGDDIVITKHRISAFAGTDLQMILHAKEIETLIMYGIATSGVVLSTLLDASDMDYRLAVIKDCCAEMDVDVHTVLVDKVFPRIAAVISANEFAAD